MREIWARVRYLFRRESYGRDLGEELDAHLQMEIDANLERGMSPDEARRLARREFGSPSRLRESAHEAWVFRWLESILQDLRYALRQLRQAPGLFLAVVASLAVGLGANTAIFSLIDAAILRPLPVADPDQLVQLEWQNDAIPEGSAGMNCGSMSVARNAQASDSARDGARLQLPCVSQQVFRALTERASGFASIIATGNPGEVAIAAAEGAVAEEVRFLHTSWNFFEALGVPLSLGRPFIEEEDRPGAEPVIIVSHRYWSNRLGRDPDAIGRFVPIDDASARIVGVAPPGFFGLTPGEWIDVYRPLASDGFSQAFGGTFWGVDMVARLAPGVSGPAAASAATPLFRSLVAETMGAEIEEELELVARPAARGLYTGDDQKVSEALWVLMLLVGVLLAIVCANVANLLLSRSVKRRAESAVRLALGAGRRRLVRQYLVESVMLAVLGGAAGLLLGVFLARSIHAVFQTGRGPGDAFAVIFDWRVSAYALAISTLTAVVFGLAPAWAAVRSQVSDGLKIHSRSVRGGGLRLGKLLVSVQFALSFAALVAAGLLGRSLGNLYATDLGFDGDQLAYATVHPAQVGYEGAGLTAYRERLEREIAAIPGVLGVARVLTRPLDGGPMSQFVEAPGGPRRELAGGIANPEARAIVSQGSPGFIEVLGLQLLAGRTLEAGEACEPGSARCRVVVDERFAEVFFPGETAIGKVFEVPGQRFVVNGELQGQPVREVVGLVADSLHGDPRGEAVPTIYQHLDSFIVQFSDHLAIRAAIDPAALAGAVRQAAGRVDPAVPLAEFHTKSGLVDRLLRTERLLALVSGAFGLAALALAALGLGGLLAYAVARRTNEIGIRMALGATGREVRRMVLGDSIRMVCAGVLVGVPAAWFVGRFLEGQLFGLEPVDAPTALLGLGTLIVIAVLASLLPARRAARVSPMTALREE